MYINSVGILFEHKPSKTSNIQRDNQITFQRTVKNSLWNNSSVSFASRAYSSVLPDKFEKPSKFKITEIPDLTCPACGHKIMTKGKYKLFLKTIRNAKEKDYIKILKNYEQYMCPVEYDLFQEIKQIANQIENEGRTPHLKKIIKKISKTKLPELEKIQLDKIEDMRSVIKKLPQSKQKFLNKELDLWTDNILNFENKAPFRRKKLIAGINSYNISDKKVKAKLVEIAESFPTSREYTCAWAVKNSGKDKRGQWRTTLETAEKLVGIASTSTDHILARNIELNHDDITNYIAMHKGCNSMKTDKNFLDWFNEMPQQRQRYIKLYLEEVQNAINEGKISDTKYCDYVKDCVLNMYNLSDGKIDFRAEFCPETITQNL